MYSENGSDPLIIWPLDVLNFEAKSRTLSLLYDELYTLSGSEVVVKIPIIFNRTVGGGSYQKGYSAKVEPIGATTKF